MANLDYYGYEVDELLRKVPINESDIGMRRVNVLPVIDGPLRTSQSEIPSTMYFGAEGSKSDGSINILINGEADASGTTIYSHSDCGYLTVNGVASSSIGCIKPGKYVMSLIGSASAASMPWDEYYAPEMSVEVHHSEGFEPYWVVYNEDDVEITVPENTLYVSFELYLRFDSFEGEHSCKFYPFLRLKVQEDEPFEPYKPDLQTQINELRDMIVNMGGYNEVQSDSVSDEVEEVTP